MTWIDHLASAAELSVVDRSHCIRADDSFCLERYHDTIVWSVCVNDRPRATLRAVSAGR
jgi:hypothetical protein